MSHFAEIDKDGIVQRVIVAEQDVIDSGLFGDSSLWVECSYIGAFRKSYPGYSYRYDKTNDVFIAPNQYPSWTLDSNFDWQPPIARPEDGKLYTWDEENTQWTEI